MIMLVNQFKLFFSRRFLPLCLVQSFAVFADSCFKYTLISYVTLVLFAAHSEQALFWVNLIGGVYALPYLLFSATAGKIADKFNRNTLIVWVKLVEILFLLLGIFSFYLHSIGLAAFVIFLLSAHSALLGPVKYSLLPSLVQPAELLAGNGLLVASYLTGGLIGSMFGIQVGGAPHGVFAGCTVALFVAFIGFACSFFVPRVPAGDHSIKLKLNFLNDIFPILRFGLQDKLIAFSIGAIVWIVFTTVAILRQVPVLAKMVGGDQRLIGLLLGTCVLGIILGAIFCNRLLKGKVQITHTSLALLVGAVCVMDLAHVTVPMHHILIAGLHPAREFFALPGGKHVCMDLFLFSAACSVYLIPFYATLQLKTLPETRGRVFACSNILSSLASLIAACLVIGIVKLHFTASGVFFFIGLLNLLMVVAFWKGARFLKTSHPMPL
jgi:acyl-[acyl-carrier-protein]-phospholipid O-acyltransferase/long-chain-fatty-acid--[acyl-carrier-protein] ligase